MKTNQLKETNDSEEEKPQIRRQSGTGNILEDRLSSAAHVTEPFYDFYFVYLFLCCLFVETSLKDTSCGFLDECKGSI